MWLNVLPDRLVIYLLHVSRDCYEFLIRFFMMKHEQIM